METIDFIAEYGNYASRSKPVPGERWRVSYFDRVDQRFYAGSDDQPMLALGWEPVSRERRRATPRDHGANTRGWPRS